MPHGWMLTDKKKIKWSNLKMIIVNYWPVTDHLILLDVSIQQLTFLISIFGGEKKFFDKEGQKSGCWTSCQKKWGGKLIPSLNVYHRRNTMIYFPSKYCNFEIHPVITYLLIFKDIVPWMVWDKFCLISHKNHHHLQYFFVWNRVMCNIRSSTCRWWSWQRSNICPEPINEVIFEEKCQDFIFFLVCKYTIVYFIIEKLIENWNPNGK